MTVFQQFLQDGVDVEARGRDGKTLLHLAAMSGSSDAAKLLIEAGENIGGLDSSWHIPLHRVRILWAWRGG